VIHLTPVVDTSPALLMRSVDGRSYEVRTRADVRTMATDLWRMAAAYQRAIQSAQQRVGPVLPEQVRDALPFLVWSASIQQSLGDLLVLLADLYSAPDVPWSSRPTDTPLLPIRAAGAVYQCSNVATLRAAGEVLLRESRAFYTSQGLTPPAPTQANPSLAAWIPSAYQRTMGVIPALPVGYAAGLWAIGIVGGLLTVYAVIRAGLAWYAPEGTARLQAYTTGVQAIQETFERMQTDCERLPEGPEREACRGRALETMLASVDRVNQAAASTWGETLRKVALIGGIAAVGWMLLSSRSS
jgi:hypothetical protein